MSENRRAPRVAILLLALSACAPKPKPTSPDDLIEQTPAPKKRASSPLVKEAEALLTAGDAQGARQKFQQALASNSKDTRALLGLGLAYEQLGKPSEAEDTYRAAITVDNTFAEAHNNLGLVLRDRGDDRAAIEQFEAALKADPTLASAQSNLALALEDSGRLEYAGVAYIKAVQLAPKDAMLRANHGLYLLSQEQTDAAVAELREGLGLATGDRAALLALGNGFRRAGKPDEAVRAMRLAIDAADGKPTPALLSELALAQNAAGDAGSAKQSLNQALTLDPKYATAHYLLASIEAASGNPKAARQHLEKCIALDPKGPLAGKAKEKLSALKKK